MRWQEFLASTEPISGRVTDDLITAAADIADAESLRGYDAVHLAGALLVGAEVLTSADVALCDAAVRRGLHVANPTASEN